MSSSSITFNKSFLSEEIECSICLDRFKIPFVGRDDKGVFSGQLLSTCFPDKTPVVSMFDLPPGNCRALDSLTHLCTLAPPIIFFYLIDF